MRVMCPHCDSKALITSSNALTATVKDLYCQCENTSACGARFVTTLAFKHTINPPANTTAEIAMSLISRLNKEEKAELHRGVLG